MAISKVRERQSKDLVRGESEERGEREETRRETRGERERKRGRQTQEIEGG